MTIIHVPCCLFIYDQFTKKMISGIMVLEEGDTLISNYDLTGKSCYMGTSQEDCEAKITQPELTIPE